MMKCNEPTGAYTAPEIRLEQIAVESGFATSAYSFKTGENEDTSLYYGEGVSF